VMHLKPCRAAELGSVINWPILNAICHLVDCPLKGFTGCVNSENTLQVILFL